MDILPKDLKKLINNFVENITFREAIKKGLKIMDTTAFTLSQENNLPIIVFDINSSDNLLKAISGEKVGTLVNI